MAQWIIAPNRRQQQRSRHYQATSLAQNTRSAGPCWVAHREARLPASVHHQLHAHARSGSPQCQAHATTSLMWRKGMLGANLNAWIDLQQEGKTRQAQEPRAIA
ncbi:hypothetical protein GCM10009091_28980 [Pseudomonas brenneri]|nr:hypothetical protein GCM10009091_28980 [Pseudomonas brenneri]